MSEKRHWQEKCREQYDAFCAMRNDINEAGISVRSAGAVLLSGPEFSHDCAALAEDIITAWNTRVRITEDQIKHMVNRFLGWKLPDDFYPDAGINFNPEYNVEWNAKRGRPPARHEPVGTNLLTATQVEAMVRYMLGDLPAQFATPNEEGQTNE